MDDEKHGISDDVNSKSRKKKQATPPRPVNQFMIYRAYMKDSVKAENPGVSNNEISRIIGAKWRALSDEEKAFWKEKQMLARAAHKKAYPNYKYAPRAARSRKPDAADATSGHGRKSNELQHTPEKEVRSNLESQSTQIFSMESLQQAYDIEQMPGHIDDQMFDQVYPQIHGHIDDQMFDQMYPQMSNLTPQVNGENINLMPGDLFGEMPASAPENLNEKIAPQTHDQMYEQPDNMPFADQHLPTMSQTPEGFDELSEIAEFLELDVDPLV